MAPTVHVNRAYLRTLDRGNWIGDQGHAVTDVAIPIKKPAHRERLDGENEFSIQINKVRYVIERIIAYLKFWRIANTVHRRPFATFATTSSAIIGLQFCRLGRGQASRWAG